MKKFFYIAFMALVAVTMLDSCLGKSVDDEFKDWRNSNEEWFDNQVASGKYTVVTAAWDPSARVLMRWHNDTMLTSGNLKPLITSTTDVKFHLSRYDGVPIDSSYYLTSPADSIFRSKVNESIEGWMMALTRMHVGDSCTVIIPYQQGYGSAKKTDELLPFTTLVFNIKLVDIYKYTAN